MAVDISALQTSFGLVLRATRTERGLSQERLALDCGLDRTYISLLERGLRQPTLTTLVVLGQALNTEAAELVRLAVSQARKKG
jgi:transcriptional regulator with XRE-family HTH domain